MQYVIGKPHTGKTTYLTRLFLERIATEGAAYFDFSGDVETILAAIPPTRRNDTVLFDPTDTGFPVGLNLLRTDDIPRTANAIVETIKSAYHYEGATPLMDLYIYTAVAALCHLSDASLLGIPYLLTDTEYRTKVVNNITDPVLKTFWQNFETLPEKERRQQVWSSLNKFYALLTDPTIRNIIGQKKTTFPMTDTTILIATFPPRLGIEKASFLATLLLYALPDYLIILDGGQHLGPKAVTEKTNIIFCHEYLAQLTPSMRETMIGSAETLTAFRLGPTDSDRLKKEFDLYDNDRQLTELWPYHYHEKTVAVKKNEYLRPPDFSFHAPQKLINHSREKFAVPGKHVEKSIERFTDSI